MNAPDLYHYKKLGMLCWLEAEQSMLVYCGLVLLTELMVWIGGGDLIIWLSDLVVGLVKIALFSSLIWVPIWLSGVGCFHGLILSCAWGRWSSLTAENWKDKNLS